MREELAALMHEIWGNWMNYVLQHTMQRAVSNFIIPDALVERWSRQMGIPYSELSEEEKESDRREADKVLALLRKYHEGSDKPPIPPQEAK